jgi:hypothetical protein
VRRATVMIVVLMGLVLGALSASGITRTAENALLPEGRVARSRAPIEQPRPLYPGCGELLIGGGTPTCDGYLDQTEWSGATVYDVSDTCGQSDGLPNPPGTIYMYLMMDEVQVYFGIDAVGDLYEDYYDKVCFYTDDNDDGCWPTQASGLTNEGNLWVEDDLSGICYLLWRWWQEDGCEGNCNACADYYGTYSTYGLVFGPELCCCGLGTQSGHMQFEVGIPFGDAATENHMIQAFLNQGETVGFYMYYLDHYYYDFMAEMPCTGDPNTYLWPCSWPSLIGEKPDFTFSMETFQMQVPIGGTLDFAKHFSNNSCQTMNIYDTLYAYKDGNVVKKFTYEWTLECEQDLDVCFALQVPKKDMFIGWDITIVNSGVGVAGGEEYPFEESFDVHIEPGHKSEILCPD